MIVPMILRMFQGSPIFSRDFPIFLLDVPWRCFGTPRCSRRLLWFWNACLRGRKADAPAVELQLGFEMPIFNGETPWLVLSSG